MAYVIRPFDSDDAATLCAIFATAVTQIGPRAYDQRQVSAWAARGLDADSYKRRVSSGHVIFVAADGCNLAVGYILVEPDGHVDHLYRHPDYSHRGIADQLLATAEHYARACGIRRLYAEASDPARSAFERAGYQLMRKREFTIAHRDRDVPIHNWATEKWLR